MPEQRKPGLYHARMNLEDDDGWTVVRLSYETPTCEWVDALGYGDDFKASDVLEWGPAVTR